MSARPLAMSVAAAFVCLATASTAIANPAPPVGYTGKQGVTCNGCHSGAAAPTVTLGGPATLAAGATGNYTLTINGVGNRAAGGVAITGSGPVPSGGILIGSGDMEVPFPTDKSEAATKTPPKTGGNVTYSFSYQAPPNGGVVTMYAVGLTANGNGGTSGDRATAITKQITINGPPPMDGGTPVDAGTDSGSSSSSSSSSSSGGTSGTSGTGGTSGSSGTSGTSGSASGETSSGSARPSLTDDDDGGCAIAAGGPVAPAGGILCAAALLACALVVRRRRS